MKINGKHISGFEFLPIIFVIILIIFGVLEIISYQNTSEVLKKSIIESAISRTKDNSNLLSQHLREFKTVIEGVSFRSSVRSMDWSKQKPVLIEEAERLNFMRFQVTDMKGFAHSTSGDSLDLSDREWIQRALEGETYLSDPFPGRIDNKVILACSTPIRNKSGDIVGTLTASIDTDTLYESISGLKAGKTGYAFIVSKEGKIISHPDKAFILKNPEDSFNNRELAQLLNTISDEQMGSCYYELNGVTKFITYTPIPGSDWILALTAPEQEVFHELDILKQKFFLLTFITIAFCILSCLLVIGYILKRKKIENLEILVEEDKRLLQESAELEKIRTQFFANISHEFRTPLNVILSSIQLCKYYFESDKAVQKGNLFKHLKTMKQNCYRLMRLVNNLIDSTKIDVGFLEKHASNNNIVQIVEDITLSIEEFTENKGINLFFEKNVDEKYIACDVDKIERIMLNLISNAIKFTDAGGSIFVKVQDKGDYIIISVKDTGVGIPKEKQKLIFERFVQVEQTLTRNHEGSGIGLAMAKSFVEMHGGSLTAVSEFGKGSEFIIELPVVTVDNPEEVIRYEEVETQKRIERINIEFSDIYYS
ncbi:MAG: pleC [Eubacterium sp.]|jgi:signal transduction histidine kinase|nr:pleC [Eubacterium sp.]